MNSNSDTRSRGKWVVLKYGGTSVSTCANWNTIADTIKERIHEGLRPLIVCSAVSGVSNLLEKLTASAVLGEHQGILAEIVGRHEALAKELSLNLDKTCGTELEQLERLAHGISLIGASSPALQARILAYGEILSTKLGQAYLESTGTRCEWKDARQLLTAVRNPQAQEGKRYLSAVCAFEPDRELQSKLDGTDATILTQGFIAGNHAGETVLLGRGGSDTSAAYFAAKLLAARLEIWTSVPGMFTANPHQISSARLLLSLDYDEAQELATAGAKVLHPQSINPVRVANVPLHLAWTENPKHPGTIIGGGMTSNAPSVKAVSMKSGIQLISMDSIGMWQQVGFLADVFGCFKKYGLSIDLVATSETNVTVTLDRGANIMDDAILNSLLEELSQYCTPRSFGPCASVSLVGKHIRAILHKIAPAFEAFENKEIYLVSQAASDLNFSFVVEEKEAQKLMTTLHTLFFSETSDEKLFGPRWTEIYKTEATADRTLQIVEPWWAHKKNQLLKIASKTTPVYVYDYELIQKKARELLSIKAVDRVHYAVKANPNAEILRLLHEEGLHFDCVSTEELMHVRESIPGIDTEKLLFTPNFAAAREYEFALLQKCIVTLDNVHPLEHHGKLFKDAKILVRVDSGIAKGHHPHVMTSGPKSKFGVSHDELDRIKTLAKKHGATIIGLHAHVGSGILAPETWAEAASYLAAVAATIDTVETIDVGGGFGIVERPGQIALDMTSVAELLQNFKDQYPKYKLWLEPGRYLVGEAGVILAKVNQLKKKSGKTFVGLDVGMNSLIRPALYSAWHEIVNLSRLDERRIIEADIVGPICETGDVLGHSRYIPESFENDIFLIGTAGAYGKAMASMYNLRKPAEDIILRS
jgi:diaminopimelate decarboxylase/aspartate kinase